MRVVALALVAVLLAPLAAADPAPTIRSCSELHCAIVRDSDGDGAYDWANAAAAADDLLVVGANANGTVVLWQVAGSTDELGGETVEPDLHEIEERTGESVDVVTLAAEGEANLTGQGGGPGFHAMDVLVAVLVMDHDTGSQETLVSRYVRVSDADGDGAPDRVETSPPLA